ncbi:MAG TPA: flagellar biosynthesis protein FlhF [Tepidisphaeraceae bacterium]|nr:flagellar biosynthesis protein FlhF [Tepidisphaeraceae bacterium]
MNLQTFKASTMAEALTQVKSSMGADAVILHTRTLHTRMWLGLRRREMVEITAGRGIGIAERRRPVPQRTSSAAGQTYSRTGTIARRPSESPDVGNNGRQLLETPAATGAAMLSISQEVAALKMMVKDLVTQTRQRQAPNIPEELFDYYTRLVSNQVCEEIAGELIKNVQRQVRPEHYCQPQMIRERLVEQLEKMIATTGPIVRTKATGPHVVALIGPTGVGKTTTLAKLAANLKLKERHRVGLITLDTYRIAAVDQLKRYADIIGSPLRVVSGADDLRDAARSMNDCEFLLIDTAGRSPNDTLKLNELRGVLAAVEPDEVHLVLSSTAGQQCLELAVSRFGEVRTDKIIFTKLDEAANVGGLLNIVRKVNKSVSYLTTGQDVPDDIEVGHARRLAELIMGEAL